MKTIINILEELNPSVDFLNEEHLIDNKLLDSLAIISLIAELEDAFEISIPMVEIIPENFNSVKQIKALVDKLSD